jgi:hypothetical protein
MLKQVDATKVVHSRSLGHLSTLNLERVVVCLPELEAAAPALVHLGLQASVLVSGGGCDTFAKGPNGASCRP